MWRDAEQRLKLRQMELQLRSAELRMGLVRDARALQGPMHWAERGYGWWRQLRALRDGVGGHGAGLGAVGAGLGGLLGLFMLFRKPGRLARAWAWVALGRKVWAWFGPRPKPTPPAAPE